MDINSEIKKFVNSQQNCLTRAYVSKNKSYSNWRWLIDLLKKDLKLNSDDLEQIEIKNVTKEQVRTTFIKWINLVEVNPLLFNEHICTPLSKINLNIHGNKKYEKLKSHAIELKRLIENDQVTSFAWLKKFEPNVYEKIRIIVNDPSWTLEMIIGELHTGLHSYMKEWLRQRSIDKGVDLQKIAWCLKAIKDNCAHLGNADMLLPTSEFIQLLSARRNEKSHPSDKPTMVWDFESQELFKEIIETQYRSLSVVGAMYDKSKRTK